MITLLTIFAAAAVIAFIIGAIVIGLAAVLDLLWFIFKLLLVALPMCISFVLARLLFGI